MNAFHFLVFVAVIVGAAFLVPRLIGIDAILAEMDNLDDEELAAALDAYPDWMTRRAS